MFQGALPPNMLALVAALDEEQAEENAVIAQAVLDHRRQEEQGIRR